MRPDIKLYYFFIWGNYPAMALAELLAALDRWHIKYQVVKTSIEAGILELNQFLPESFINQLGGTIKLGELIESLPSKEVTPEHLANYLTAKLNVAKIIYGLSQYRLHNFIKPLTARYLQTLGRATKKILKKHQPARWVVSREPNLSAVVVERNKLIGPGVELVLLHESHKIWLGRTTAVQPFAAYSERDYGRLVVDAKVGMIPPKLAQMMLNLSGCNPANIILDPFCGFGTILQEALLMGWHHVVGADVSPLAIEGSKKNLNWLKEKYKLKDSIARLFLDDARLLSSHLRGSYVEGIITEPYLGPALRGRLTKAMAGKVKVELEALYLSAFIDFAKYLKPGGRVVMVWPVFILNDRQDSFIFIDLIDKLAKYDFKLLRPYHAELYKYKVKGYTPRDTFIYGRPQQKVWREIVVFDYQPKK